MGKQGKERTEDGERTRTRLYVGSIRYKYLWWENKLSNIINSI
jgi:hypothetical protein